MSAPHSRLPAFLSGIGYGDMAFIEHVVLLRIRNFHFIILFDTFLSRGFCCGIWRSWPGV